MGMSRLSNDELEGQISPKFESEHVRVCAEADEPRLEDDH